ncbi:MAG: hypothetical protein KA715_14810 [Xanthomonadaceae bacterium]|nr:hypothetical protein [Xanthomonadaceae bacterium]
MMKNTISLTLAVLCLFQNPAFAQNAGNPVPHTNPRDQGYVGFCWSYTLMGLMEGEALKSGKTITLSPEYVGFYHMYDGFLKGMPTFKALARKKLPTTGFGKKVWEPVRKMILEQALGFLQQTPSEGSPGMQAPFDYAAKYGIVPESIFETKISKERANMEKRIINYFSEKLQLKDTVADYEAHPEKLLAEFAIAFGATPPKPNDKFVYEGKEYTPLTFAKDYLNFDSSEYKEVIVTRSNQTSVYPKIQKSLADGNAVPMGFIIFGDTFEKTKQTGVFDSTACPNGTCEKISGGHAVLIVNEVYNGVIIKNSWGQTGHDVMGQASGDKSQYGFYTVTQSYLDNPFRLTVTDKPTDKNPNPQPKPRLSDDAQGYTIVLKKQYL